MATSEFDIIKKYFSPSNNRSDVVLNGGDDCAIVTPPKNSQLAVTTDTLVSGVHFPPETSACDIAYKSLAVNFSDLAAMGATPAWVSLAITLPEVDAQWLDEFSKQFKTILDEMNVALIGGDTTNGPLSITINAIGFLQDGKSMQRSAAKVGDKVFVTGSLGDAAVGLRCVQNKVNDDALSDCITRLNRPEARNEFAQSLLDFCDCAIDVSDGLLADLGHVLSASHCGARLDLSKIHLSDALQHYFKCYCENKIDWSLIVAHGDDYELCFTVAETDVSRVYELADKQGLRVSCIGEITKNKALVCMDERGQEVDGFAEGYLHFS